MNSSEKVNKLPCTSGNNLIKNTLTGIKFSSCRLELKKIKITYRSTYVKRVKSFNKSNNTHPSQLPHKPSGDSEKVTPSSLLPTSKFIVSVFISPLKQYLSLEVKFSLHSEKTLWYSNPTVCTSPQAWIAANIKHLKILLPFTQTIQLNSTSFLFSELSTQNIPKIPLTNNRPRSATNFEQQETVRSFVQDPSSSIAHQECENRV